MLRPSPARLLPALLTTAVFLGPLATTGTPARTEPALDLVASALPAPVPPHAPTPVSAMSWYWGRLDVFAQSTSGTLLHTSYIQKHGWNRIEDLGGPITSGPSAISTGYRGIAVFARGTDGTLIHREYNAGRWGPWRSLAKQIVGEPAAVATTGGRVDVFARGTDNELWSVTYDGRGWQPWTSLGGTWTSSPAAGSTDGTQRIVLTRGTDNAIWYQQTFGGQWQAPASLGGSWAGAPGANTQPGGEVNVYARTTEGAIYQRRIRNGSWSEWGNQGGSVGAGPGAVSWGPGHTAALTVGTDGRVYQRAYYRKWYPWDRVPIGPVMRDYGMPLGPGVHFRATFDPTGPWVVRVVDVDLSAASTIDVALAGDRLPGLEQTSALARRHNALVAINGDYFISPGRPVHAYAEDGRFIQAPQMVGRQLALNAEETEVHMDFPAISARAVLPSQEIGVTHVNSGPPTSGQVALFTAAGGTVEQPPANACTARLRRTGPPAFTAEGAVNEPYTVTSAVCQADQVPTAPDDAALSAPQDGSYAPVLRDLPVDSAVTTRWSLGWPRILDTIGGNPLLLQNGAVLSGSVDGVGSYFGRNPRTAVGIANGHLLLVVVDGRLPGVSVGMTLRELAELFQRLGASDALNLDGGGSTTMTVGDVVINHPSDGFERPVSNALLVLAGPDDGEAGIAGPMANQAAVMRAVNRDPGSTGGFASALRRQGVRLTGAMRASADAYDTR